MSKITNVIQATASSLREKDLICLVEDLLGAYVISCVALIVRSADDHTDCDDDCPLKFGQELTEAAILSFKHSLRDSVKKTFEANGMVFGLDPNKEVRDEILRQVDH